MKSRNELYSQTFLRYLPKEILSLMLPYPPSTVPIKPFFFTDCSTIWVSLVISLIDFLHTFPVEFKLALFTLFTPSLTIIRSSIIQTLTIPNSRTLLLQVAFLVSLTLFGFTPIIIIKECLTDNKVKLKDDKTEIMFISPHRMSTSLSTQDCFAHVVHQFHCISHLIIYVLLLTVIYTPICCQPCPYSYL